MNFANGMLNLTSWLGNVIMPTVAGLFAAAAIVSYTKGRNYQHLAYAALAIRAAQRGAKVTAHELHSHRAELVRKITAPWDVEVAYSRCTPSNKTPLRDRMMGMPFSTHSSFRIACAYAITAG